MGALRSTVQQVVSLQEAVERTEDGRIEHDVKWDGLASGEVGEDEAPAQCQSISHFFYLCSAKSHLKDVSVCFAQ